MSAHHLRLNASTHEDRDQMLSRARSAISDSGGWILDVKMFSNISVFFSFEIPLTRIDRLSRSLADSGLRLNAASIASLASLSRSPEDGTLAQDVSGSLQITFVHNEPDLRIEVPPIPG